MRSRVTRPARSGSASRGRALLPSAVALVALTGLGACTEIDNALASIPIFAFMRQSPAFDPYEAPRLPPDHSVAFESPTGPVPALPAPGEAGLRAFGAAHPNPTPRSAESDARGEAMYARYCQVCHGPAGMGGNTGPVTATGVYPPIIPPLATGNAVSLTDGYIYAVIRAGRGLMPAYGVQVPHADRWHIVNYVRRLQEGGGPTAGAAAGAAPPATSADSAAAPDAGQGEN